MKPRPTLLAILCLALGAQAAGLAVQPARPAAAHGLSVRRLSINTQVVVPSSVDVALGSAEDITVQVTATGSSSAPTGRVSLYNGDIPNSVKFASHDVALVNGTATFHLSEAVPGVPFQVSNANVVYHPATDSGFNGSSSPPFTVEMDRWQPTVTDSLGRDDGNGQDVPVSVAVTGLSGKTPVGYIVVSDAWDGGEECQSRLALLYGDAGQLQLNLNLPPGQNTLGVTYQGDAFFGAAAAPAPQTPNITTGGWTGTSCPSDWAQVTRSVDAAPPSGADVPNRRYGIPIAYGTPDDPGAMANRDVGTVVVPLNWSDVQPSATTYDFTAADDEVAAAMAQGKKVALVLRFQAGLVPSGTWTKAGDCGWYAGHTQYLPQWVGTQLAAATPPESFCSHGISLMIPEYWGPTFLGLWTAFVDQVALHFASVKDDIAYVRGAVGLGDEAKAIQGPNSQPTTRDIGLLQAWGYTPQMWEAWQEGMMLYYQQAFSYLSPPAQVLYTINHQDTNGACTGPATESIPTFGDIAVPCTGKPVEVDVSRWAVDHGMGLGQNSLAPFWAGGNPDSGGRPAGPLRQIFAYAMKQPNPPLVELQPFEALSTWCNYSVNPGNPPCFADPQAFVKAEQDISFARSQDARVIEWYQDDLTDADLAPAFDLWNQLQAVPGHGKVPTTVNLSQTSLSAHSGGTINVTVTVSAPGITACVPGGTVRLYINGLYVKSVSIPLTSATGSVTTQVTLPDTTKNHVNLSASYVDVFSVVNKNGVKVQTGTWLWMPSSSTNLRVAIS